MKCKNHNILGWKSDTKQKSPIQSKYFFNAGRYSRHFLIECSKYQDFHRCFQNSLSFLLKKKKMAFSSLSSFCLIAMEMGAISFRFVFERAQQFQGADWLSTINMGVNLSIIILIPIDVYTDAYVHHVCQFNIYLSLLLSLSLPPPPLSLPPSHK